MRIKCVCFAFHLDVVLRASRHSRTFVSFCSSLASAAQGCSCTLLLLMVSCCSIFMHRVARRPIYTLDHIWNLKYIDKWTCITFIRISSCFDFDITDYYLLQSLDVIGVCKTAEDVSRITTKSSREVSKRTLHLIDTTGKMVAATLWGDKVIIKGSLSLSFFFFFRLLVDLQVKIWISTSHLKHLNFVFWPLNDYLFSDLQSKFLILDNRLNNFQVFSWNGNIL